MIKKYLDETGLSRFWEKMKSLVNPILEKIETLNTRSSQMEESIKSIAASGGASTASAVTFDNTQTDLVAVNAQAAIEELNGKNGEIKKTIDKVDIKTVDLNKRVDNLVPFEKLSYDKALQAAQNSNKMFSCIITDENVNKPVWHIGNEVFVDATGAEVSWPIDENLKYTVKLTTDNEKIYVPVQSSAISFDVDWGDGSEIEHYTNPITGNVYHIYDGIIGDEYQITVRGGLSVFLFSVKAFFPCITALLSIDNNTLPVSNFGNKFFANCVNLKRLSKNALRNCTNTDLTFSGCTALEEVDALKYMRNKDNVTHISFENCTSLILQDDVFDGFDNITSFYRLFKGCVFDITDVLSNRLKTMIAKVGSFRGMFYGYKGTYTLPNDFFDNIPDQTTIDLYTFTHISEKGLTGDAKVLYDTLVDKITSDSNTKMCFTGAGLANRNQVPTTWGGTMSV